MPLVGGSSSGTRAGRSSLIGGVPRFRRLFGVKGISKDIVCSVDQRVDDGGLCDVILHTPTDDLSCDHSST